MKKTGDKPAARGTFRALSKARRPWSLFALGLALLVSISSPPTRAESVPDLITVIAFDNAGRKAWGMAYGVPPNWGAEDLAVQYCERRGGKDCQVLVFNWNSCLAVAGPKNTAEPEIYYGAGGNLFNPNQRQTAIDTALSTCLSKTGKECALREVGCGADEVPEFQLDPMKKKPKPKPKAQ